MQKGNENQIAYEIWLSEKNYKVEVNYESSFGYNDPIFLRYVIEYFDEFIIS